MIKFWPSLRSFAVHCNWNLSNLSWLIIWYLDTSLVCVASFSLASRDVIALINFTMLLCIIFMHMFYRVMKWIHQFAANLLSYIPTKYYWNWSTSDLLILWKAKGWTFFETQSYMMSKKYTLSDNMCLIHISAIVMLTVMRADSRKSCIWCNTISDVIIHLSVARIGLSWCADIKNIVVLEWCRNVYVINVS